MPPPENMQVRCEELEPGGEDPRGLGFALGRRIGELVGQPRDVHVMTIEPGHVRGNHAHLARREVLLVQYEDAWSLHADEGKGTAVRVRRLAGAGACLVTVDPGCAHALRNDGARPLFVVALSDGDYDPASGETVRREVVSPPTRR